MRISAVSVIAILPPVAIQVRERVTTDLSGVIGALAQDVRDGFRMAPAIHQATRLGLVPVAARLESIGIAAMPRARVRVMGIVAEPEREREPVARRIGASAPVALTAAMNGITFVTQRTAPLSVGWFPAMLFIATVTKMRRVALLVRAAFGVACKRSAANTFRTAVAAGPARIFSALPAQAAHLVIQGCRVRIDWEVFNPTI